MATITEDYVSFETAKLLEEIGRKSKERATTTITFLNNTIC